MRLCVRAGCVFVPVEENKGLVEVRRGVRVPPQHEVRELDVVRSADARARDLGKQTGFVQIGRVQGGQGALR